MKLNKLNLSVKSSLYVPTITASRNAAGSAYNKAK